MWLSDEEYIYRQDIKEKKSAGRGAFYKKNGSKSKKCSLPSDFMSRKEIKKLSGECNSWSMKEFYSYKEFKKMPDDLALQYVNSLINRFNIGIGIISEDVMGCTSMALKNNLKSRGVLEYVNKSPSGGAASKGRIALADAMSKAKREKEIKMEEPVENSKEDSMSESKEGPIPLPEPRIFANCHSMQVEMDDWDTDILDFLRNRFAGDHIRITITIDKES